MDARRVIQRIVTILIIIVGTCDNPVVAGHVRIYRGEFNLPIPKLDISDPYISKGWMEDAIIQVPDHFTIYDLDVGITVTHSSAFDLQIYLESPAGTKICLNMYNFTEFFKGENYEDTIFDDEAEIPIEMAQPPFTGSFRPEVGYLLESFDGQDAYGPWRLQIYDAHYYHTGALNIFKLIFTEIPEPATSVLLVFATFLAVLKRPRGRGRPTFGLR